MKELAAETQPGAADEVAVDQFGDAVRCGEEQDEPCVGQNGEALECTSDRRPCTRCRQCRGSRKRRGATGPEKEEGKSQWPGPSVPAHRRQAFVRRARPREVGRWSGRRGSPVPLHASPGTERRARFPLAFGNRGTAGGPVGVPSRAWLLTRLARLPAAVASCGQSSTFPYNLTG